MIPEVMESGVLRADVVVSLDGERLPSTLEGRAIEIDPGLHVFTFATDAGVLTTEKILVLQGQRNRTISVLLPKRKLGEPSAAAASAPTTAPDESDQAEAEPAETAEQPTPKPQVACEVIMPLVEQKFRAAPLEFSTGFVSRYELMKATANGRVSPILSTKNHRVWEKVTVTVSCLERHDPLSLNIEPGLVVSEQNSSAYTDWHEAPGSVLNRYNGELATYVQTAAAALCGRSRKLVVDQVSDTYRYYRCE